MPIWGTPRGIVDVVPNEGTVARTMQAAFKVFYDACEEWVSAGYAERVSLYWGSGGTGTDFWDGTNPFGSNAWLVYRFPPTPNRKYSYYVHAQYSEGAGNFGAGGGAPGLTQNSTGTSPAAFAMQFAMGIDGSGNDASPWNGTTNFDGADTKGAAIWAAPGGGSVHVWPRSNNSGGSHATFKENFINIQDSNNLTHRFDYLHDGDHFLLMVNFQDAAVAYDPTYFGPFLPRRDIGGEEGLRFVCVHTNDPNPGGTAGTTVNTYGSLTGTTFDDGGVLWDSSIGVRAFSPVSWGGGSSATDYMGNVVVSTLAPDMGKPVFPLMLSSEETGYIGIVGQTYAEKWGYHDSSNSAQDDVHPAAPPYTNCIRTTSGGPAWHEIFMWGGNEAPRFSTTRAGRVV